MCALLSGLYIGGDHEGGVQPKKEKNVSLRGLDTFLKGDNFLDFLFFVIFVFLHMKTF